MAQLKDFVGRLGGLQNEHQALRLRKFPPNVFLARTVLNFVSPGRYRVVGDVGADDEDGGVQQIIGDPTEYVHRVIGYGHVRDVHTSLF